MGRRVAIFTLLALLGAGTTLGATAQTATVVVNDGNCANGWHAPASGRTVFTIQNTAPNDSFFVQLVAGSNNNPQPALKWFGNADGAIYGKVYGQISVVAARTDAAIDAVLPPGPYFFRCLDSNGNTYTSQVERVGGKARAAVVPVAPVSPNQLATAMQAYRREVAPVMTRLAADTDRLMRAVQARRLAEARTLWLPAHLDYARLGVAYGTFGALDTKIDGRPLGLPRGVNDPGFTGFLRLEYGLWHGQSAARLAPVASALDSAVHTLVKRSKSLAELLWVNTDLPLRAHEILENTLQFELTGETNEGSGTNLATAWANAEGTMLALDALRPLLRLRDPGLTSTALTKTARLATAFKAYERPHGGWRPLASLSTLERERLDSETSALLEQLDLIPGALQLQPLGPSSD